MSKQYRPYRGAKANIGKAVFSTSLVVFLVLLFSFSAYRFFFFVPDKNNSEDESIPVESNSGMQDDTKDNETSDDGLGGDVNNVNPPIEDQPLHAVVVPFSQTFDSEFTDSVIEKCRQENYNTVIFEIKDAAGNKAYTPDANENRQNSAAAEGQEASSENMFRGLCAKLREGNIRTAAKISAFRDNAASSAERALAVKTSSGARWLDVKYIGWLNPYNEQACEHIYSLVAEVAALGFDEVILDNFCFPYSGQLGLISYGSREQDKITRMKDVASGLISAAEQAGCKVSVILTPQAAKNGEDKNAGQSIASFGEYFDKMYVNTSLNYEDYSADAQLINKNLTDKAGALAPSSEFVAFFSTSGGTQQAAKVFSASSDGDLSVGEITQD